MVNKLKEMKPNDPVLMQLMVDSMKVAQSNLYLESDGRRSLVQFALDFVE